MINLLPPEVKQSIGYARRNTMLRKWSFALLISIVGIFGIVGSGYLFLRQSINSYSSQVSQGNQTLEQQKLGDTQKQVQELTNGLKLVDQVLRREVLFSKLLSQIGAALPGGSILNSLSINKVQGGIDLQAAATDYQTATQVQVNLQDPKNQIFEKADIVNIQCTPAASGTAAQYPCSVQIRALFAKNNSFTFISPSGSNAP